MRNDIWTEVEKLEQQAQHYADLAREAYALWAEPTNTDMQRRVYVSRMLDAKGKILGVPCYELLGGKIRDRIPVYWSHCPTWRINHPKFFGPAITDLDGVTRVGAEARERGFKAVKTNIFLHDDGPLRAWRPLPRARGPRRLRRRRVWLQPRHAGLRLDRRPLREPSPRSRPPSSHERAPDTSVGHRT